MSANTYWESKGTYQTVAKKLQQLIPFEGTVKNPRKNRALEKMRKASNCYYDLYNNGLCNRAREFTAVFGFSSKPYQVYGRRGSLIRGYFTLPLYERVEEKMDEIIVAAALEQGIELVVGYETETA